MLAIGLIYGCGTLSQPPVSPTAGTSASTPAVAADPCQGPPDSEIVYCALNSAVTQATIRQTICVVGWTATIRPDSSYTDLIKGNQIYTLQLPDQNPSDYEEDHRMPLELGGAPSDTMNLSPELHPGSFAKDKAENAARAAVCAGADLRATQQAFIARWLDVWPDYKPV